VRASAQTEQRAGDHREADDDRYPPEENLHAGREQCPVPTRAARVPLSPSALSTPIKNFDIL
jgi:hypothetical protein